MTTKELRHKVIKKINKVEDENLLKALIRIIDINVEVEELYKKSEEHCKSLNSKKTI